MDGNGNVIVVYALYVGVAVGLTIWLARTLFRNGTVFLQDVFEGQAGLATQPVLVPVELVGAGTQAARERFGRVPGLGKELVVGDDEGHVWVGPAAFLMCLWATARYRSWAFRLMKPRYHRFAERVFVHVSKRRGRYSEWLRRDDADCSYCDELQLWWDE